MVRKIIDEKIYANGTTFDEQVRRLQADAPEDRHTLDDVQDIATLAVDAMRDLLDTDIPDGAIYITPDHALVRRISDDATFEADVDTHLQDLERSRGECGTFGQAPWEYCFELAFEYWLNHVWIRRDDT